MTTFTSYGAVARHRQTEIMRELRGPQKPTVVIPEDLLRQIAVVIEVSREQRQN